VVRVNNYFEDHPEHVLGVVSVLWGRLVPVPEIKNPEPVCFGPFG
jgi:hypothetical protein